MTIKNWYSDQLSIFSEKSNIGLARSIIAAGTLLTLLFNSPDLLFINIASKDINIKQNFISLFWLLGPDHIYLGVIASAIILLTVISGVWPRYTCFLHWWVSYSIFNSTHLVDGGDQITNVLTLFLIPICIQSNKNHWLGVVPTTMRQKTISHFFLSLARFQICFLYFQAAIDKLSVPEWKDGTAFYYFLNNRAFYTATSSTLVDLVANPLIVIIVTWGSIAIEFSLSIAFFVSSKYWRSFFYLGLFFHFLIFLTLGLTSFSIAMSGALIIYLVPYYSRNTEILNREVNILSLS